jgi:hypothetical protein
MKYNFSITYRGEINSTPKEDAMETIGHIADLVHQSFPPDLQAGVVLEGSTVHIDQMREPTHTIDRTPLR